MDWTLIPSDALNLILEYDGRIKYKNGKYTDRIHKNDKRYTISIRNSFVVSPEKLSIPMIVPHIVPSS